MSDHDHLSLLGQDHDGDTQGSQYLSFLLDGEQYAVSILRVQEIRGWETATRVPNTPIYLKGVINLRGNIVPVYDLRARFGMPVADYSKETVVIVVRHGKSDDERSMGLVVDAVSDVLVVQDEQISQTPEFDGQVPTEHIMGLASAGDDMVMLLDVDSLAERPGVESAVG